MLEIIEAWEGKDIDLARGLFEEYADWGHPDWTAFPEEFQAFQEQLANLPAGFAPPDGCLLLGVYQARAAGCVALRKLSDEICEMKRLYVTPEFRRLGIGRALAQAVIEQARKIGYTSMRLDTVAAMKAAGSLYVSIGFKEIEPYRYRSRLEIPVCARPSSFTTVTYGPTRGNLLPCKGIQSARRRKIHGTGIERSKPIGKGGQL